MEFLRDKGRRVKTEGRLFYGCAHKDVDLVRSQLDAGLDVNAWWGDLGYPNQQSGSYFDYHYDDVPADATTRARDWEDYRPFLDSTPLHTAVQHTTFAFRDIDARGLAVIRLLLERGADPNTNAIHAGLSDGETPLRVACLKRGVYPDGGVQTCLAVVRLLLDFGADVNERDHSGKTILFRMAELRNPTCEVASLLLERGADMHVRFRGTQSTPLFRAIQPADVSWAVRNRLAFARVLLERGASVELGLTDRHGKIIETPLHYACRYSCVGATRLLLVHGASFDEYNGSLRTPLSLVRDFDKVGRDPPRPPPRVAREMNELFDAYLQHYWKLRVRLRVFGPVSEHLLDLHVAPFLIGDGVLKKRSG